MSSFFTRTLFSALILLLVNQFSFAQSKSTAAQIVEDEVTTANLERFENTNPEERKKRELRRRKFVADVLAGRDPEKTTPENSDSTTTQSDK